MIFLVVFGLSWYSSFGRFVANIVLHSCYEHAPRRQSQSHNSMHHNIKSTFIFLFSLEKLKQQIQTIKYEDNTKMNCTVTIIYYNIPYSLYILFLASNSIVPTPLKNNNDLKTVSSEPQG